MPQFLKIETIIEGRGPESRHFFLFVKIVWRNSAGLDRSILLYEPVILIYKTHYPVSNTIGNFFLILAFLQVLQFPFIRDKTDLNQNRGHKDTPKHVKIRLPHAIPFWTEPASIELSFCI